MKHFVAVAMAIWALGFAGTSSADAANAGGGAKAVTLWWVIFNNPENCKANPGALEQCGGVDVFGQDFLESVAAGTPDPGLIAPNADAGLAVLYATGATTNANGRIRLAASIYRSPEGALDFTGPSLVDPMGLGRALENADAEIHLIVRTHGTSVRGGMISQITGFLDPYCSDPTLLYFAGTNTCADVQFSVFGPGESGEDTIYAFGETPTEVRNGRAFLIRNTDMVQAVIETRVRD
jgi:hypothetical protein